MVFNSERQRLAVCAFTRQFNLLCGNREVSVRGYGFFDPDFAERQAVDDEFAGSVSDHVGDRAVRIVEEAAVRFLAELQDFKVAFALDLQTEACACQRIAGLRIHLDDLQPGGTVLDVDDLRIGNAVFIGQRKGDGALEVILELV